MRDKEASCQGDQTQHYLCSAGIPVLWPHQDDLESLEEALKSSLSQPTETSYSSWACHGVQDTKTLGGTE